MELDPKYTKGHTITKKNGILLNSTTIHKRSKTSQIQQRKQNHI